MENTKLELTTEEMSTVNGSSGPEVSEKKKEMLISDDGRTIDSNPESIVVRPHFP